MDILFTGNTALVTEGLLAKMESDYQCVIFGEQSHFNTKKKNIIIYQKSEDNGIEQVFQTFDFEAVLYFSASLDGKKKIFDELEKLEYTLYLCRKNNVKKIIYIMSNDLVEQTGLKNDSRIILMNACEMLCQSAASKDGMAADIIKMPYFYCQDGGECQLSAWVDEAMQTGKVTFPGRKEAVTDFLCDEDLGELLDRMLDEPPVETFRSMAVGGENQVTFLQLAELFQENRPDLVVQYQEKTECIPICYKEQRPRKEYGWYPVNQLQDGVEQDFLRQRTESKRKFFRKIYLKRRNLGKKITVLLEQLFLLGMVELINYWVKDNVLLNFIDFRLLYVIIMGTMNGLNAGIMAAVFSCVGFGIANAGDISWQLLFYNVQNWLPFACYFLLGTITGYTKDKHEEAVTDAKEEYKILEDKYIFLNGLYRKVLEGKERFNNQIIGYKDSFGKMYSVVKKLNSMLPEQVFFEAVNVLEEMLGNTTVAIYSVNPKSRFARLYVCSRKCNDRLGKSIQITDYPQMMPILEERDTFINSEALENYPAYATGIFRNHELTGMILLLQADYKQMNMEFSNKFRIIADLIQDSLIRAMDFYEQKEYALADTKILEASEFKAILEVKRQMHKKQYLDYSLLKIERDQRSLKELNDMLSRLVRDNDVLGLGTHGDLYLLLSQTRSEDVKNIADRLHKSGIVFDVVKEEE